MLVNDGDPIWLVETSFSSGPPRLSLRPNYWADLDLGASLIIRFVQVVQVVRLDQLVGTNHVIRVVGHVWIVKHVRLKGLV